MGQIQTLDELISLLIRRRLLIGAVVVFGMVITFLYVIAKPDVFESTAVIQVQSANLPETAAGTSQNVGQSAQRLQAIEQRLTTRGNLLTLIARHKLYSDLPISDDEKVDLLRKSIRFDAVASAASPPFGSAPQVSALLIMARAATRQTAARLANDLAQGILDAGAEGQINRARETVSFFRDEEARLMAEVATLDAEISAYKSANGDALPDRRELYRDQIGGLDSGLRAIDQTLVAARNDADTISKKEPQRATDLRQLDALAARIATLTAQRDSYVAQRNTVVEALSRMPEVEQTLSEYGRRQDLLQSQLDLVASRRAAADTSQKLENRQQGENFTLLERAIEPQYPISTERRKLAIVGTLGSLMLGLVAAFAMDIIFPAVRTRTQLQRQLDLMPIVAIPEITFGRSRPVAKQPAWKQLFQQAGGAAPKRSGGMAFPNVAGAASASLTPLQKAMGGGAVILLLLAAAALT